MLRFIISILGVMESGWLGWFSTPSPAPLKSHLTLFVFVCLNRVSLCTYVCCMYANCLTFRDVGSVHLGCNFNRTTLLHLCARSPLSLSLSCCYLVTSMFDRGIFPSTTLPFLAIFHLLPNLASHNQCKRGGYN